MATKILITGGSGMTGRYLSRMLPGFGFEVAILSRKPGHANGITTFLWDPGKGRIDPEAIKWADGIINLAGAGIADKRWTGQYKKELYDSRINATRLIADTLKTTPHHIGFFISASATGIYGDEIHGVADETYPAAGTFLAKVCRDWEAEALKIGELNIRTTILRTAPVLAAGDGFIKKLSTPVRYFIGAPLGSGQQQTSWIHIQDLCHMYLEAARNKAVSGIYNAASPHPVTNREITEKIARKLHRKILLPPIPGFVLKIVLGDIADSLTGSQEVQPARFMSHGFHFAYPHIDQALSAVFPE